MAKLDALFEVQAGTEASDAWGTEVASTVKLMGVEELTISPIITAEQVDELRGTLQPGYRSHIRAAHGEATVGGCDRCGGELHAYMGRTHGRQ